MNITQDPRLDLEEVNSEIQRAQAVLNQLLEKRAAVKRRINSRYSYILRLPVETLSEIFMACYPLNDRDQWASNSPLLLGSICSAWRAVALSTPQLWCTISLDTHNKGYYMDNLILFREWLARTGEQPLSLALRHAPEHSSSMVPSVDKEAVREGLDLVARCSKRWENVDLYMVESFKEAGCLPPEDFPLLKTLRLALQPEDFKLFHSASQLRQVRLRRFDHLVAAALSLPQNSNMRLILEGGTVNDCLEVLRHRPNLVHFGIEDISLSHLPLFEPATAPVLQSLEVGNPMMGSRLSTHDSLAFKLIANLTAPTLCSLSIFSEDAYWVEVSQLAGFICRSKCSLTELSISVLSIDLAECLATTPALEKLHLSAHEIIPEDWMKLVIEQTPDVASAGPILVPNLTYFTYTHTDGHDLFDYEGLARMLASRRQPLLPGTGSFSRIVEFNLVYSHPSIPEDSILEESIDLRMGYVDEGV